ncbi:hypothetical protein SCAR479_08479 [Seiridium cardinale]|uniref:Uncharacterized protein n=1 Tax=Seiridium cardinale TaxID=138064 RepID=A0ABR2XML4_9PEZI
MAGAPILTVFATVRKASTISTAIPNADNVTVLMVNVLSSDSIAIALESVNKSGGNIFLPALDTPIADGKKLFDLNFWSPFAMLHSFAPLLIEAKGCIINNTSAMHMFLCHS